MDQIGQKITCPDCYKQFEVPQPRPKARQSLPEDEEIGEYALSRPIEPPTDVRGRKSLASRLQGTDRLKPWVPPRERPVLPRWPLVSGVFTFPVYPGTWICWVALSFPAILALYLTFAAIALAAIATQITWFGSLIFASLAGVLSFLWFVVASAYLLTILKDTAEGYERIENWPEAVFLDWIFDCLYLFNSVAASVAVGLGLERLLGLAELPAGFGLAGSALFLFPILLLSMIERNSPVNPLSAPIWSSLLGAWPGWLVFYLESALLFALAFGMAALATILGPFTLAAWGVLIVAGLLIYFRLLGRLAWYCIDRAAGPHRSSRRGSNRNPRSRQRPP